MAANYLLAMPRQAFAQATFAAEHQQQHRVYLALTLPPNNFATGPNGGNILDPQQNIGKWRLDHQRAQNSALTGLGIASNQNLLDYDLVAQGPQTWWTFANHLEHYAANNLVPKNPPSP
jgi:hypothetical protein